MKRLRTVCVELGREQHRRGLEDLVRAALDLLTLLG
jgi:hypothetical protein